MRIKLTVTTDIIDKSLMCGIDGRTTIDNCGMAILYQLLIPNTIVSFHYVWFALPNGKRISQQLTVEQRAFVNEFDQYGHNNPHDRYNLVGREFFVTIPDEVIEVYYQSAVDAVQKIIEQPALEFAYPGIDGQPFEIELK